MTQKSTPTIEIGLKMKRHDDNKDSKIIETNKTAYNNHSQQRLRPVMQVVVHNKLGIIAVLYNFHSLVRT